MPKIIEHLEERLVEEARRQAETGGDTAMTIRSVAKNCGVGVGTVYNYFPSKDALLATYMLNDWNRCMDAINAVSTYSDKVVPVLRCMYDQLVGFAKLHHAVFSDEAAAASFAGSFGSYHKLLRSQLAQPLRKFCGDDFEPEFIAEALLTWSMEGKSFDEIWSIISKLF